ncbi:hypothetical protein [Alteromonas sp. 14N.309.X.WAT.G.H12]|uniref:hypothetical protein n=1 Tax=Alteromonas sp. 14N.309.X.WAT.G.H12 TaxID=3120824 RepID=UPI002FD0AA88
MMRWVYLVFILLITPGHAFAEDAAASEDEGQYGKLKTVMGNTSNQFIYAFFGKGLLLYFLDDSEDIKAVSVADESELSQLSKPFNAVFGQLFIIGLTAIYGLSVIYFLVKLGGFGIKEVWELKSNGKSRMSGDTRRGFWAKLVLLGGLVILPVPLKTTLLDDQFYTNPVTALLFDVLGKASAISDEATSDLIKRQRQTLSTLPLPASDAKQDSAMAMNIFFTCLRTQEYREQDAEYQEELKLYPQPGSGEQVLRGRVKIGECGLDVRLGVDRSTDEDMQALNLDSETFDFDENMFANTQISVLTNVLTQQLERALSFSAELAKEDTYSDMNTGQPTLLSYTAQKKDNIELTRWLEDCDELEKWSSGSDSIMIKDRALFNQLTARCSSYHITKALVYPDTYSALDEYLSSPGNQREQIAMCVDQATIDDIMSGVYVSNYKLLESSASTSNIESVALDACVVKQCSESNLLSGGLYACANAVDMYSTRSNDFRIADRGSMMLGFYMFNLFLHHPASDSAKNIFNQLQFSFFDSSEGIINEQGEPTLSVSFTVPQYGGNGSDKANILSDLVTPLSGLGIPTISPAPEFGSVSKITGYSRLLTCVQSPLQVKNGYVCSNVPQEFSRFGIELIKGAVAFKTALLMGDTVSRTGRFFSLSGKNTGSLEEAAGTAVQSAIRRTGELVLPAAGATSVSYLTEMAGNIGFGVTDEFGELNSSVWADLGATMGVDAMFVIGLVGTDSALMSFVDTVLLIALIAGVVFGIIIPLFPMLLVLSALSKFLYLIIKTIVLHGFKLTDVIFDSDTEFLTEGFDAVWADWLAVILKLPLTVIGVVLAWLLSNVVISKVMSSMSFAFETNDGPAGGLIDTVVIMGISLVVVAIVYNMVLTVIESFYDFTVEWVLGQMTNSPFGDQRAVGWKDAKGILTMMGR